MCRTRAPRVMRRRREARHRPRPATPREMCSSQFYNDENDIDAQAIIKNNEGGAIAYDVVTCRCRGRSGRNERVSNGCRCESLVVLSS
ncbi:hypothetical protein EVAR_82697_1 [Eumeta japonica]|uniref:Uncharacterized protein n=1 Tax=Eumeta variegata TaxID=151549 RepID=A0A4C1VBU4_EUMVA|nr:hypothetical protein EVAR_82697_1 [Eumeta japonica]